LTQLSAVALLGLALLTAPLAAQAQKSEKPRVGWLTSSIIHSRNIDAFRQGMRVLGYVDVPIESCAAAGHLDRLPALATELLALGIDVMVTDGGPAAVAAKQATTAELGSKRLELLVSTIPGLRRVALLGAKTDPFTRPYVQDFENSAGPLGLELQPVLVDGSREFDGAFAEMSKTGAQAVVIQPLFQPHTKHIVELASKHHLALMSSYRDTTQAGGLISYSADHAAYFQRSAIFVDRILKGAKPGDLPVEQPTQFECVINLKTAKALGLTIPPAVLARADEVIQ
jgi:ABC-type uncharacterized transport system substrate-binding protein